MRHVVIPGIWNKLLKTVCGDAIFLRTRVGYNKPKPEDAIGDGNFCETTWLGRVAHAKADAYIWAVFKANKLADAIVCTDTVCGLFIANIDLEYGAGVAMKANRFWDEEQF